MNFIGHSDATESEKILKNRLELTVSSCHRKSLWPFWDILELINTHCVLCCCQETKSQEKEVNWQFQLPVATLGIWGNEREDMIEEVFHRI